MAQEQRRDAEAINKLANIRHETDKPHAAGRWPKPATHRTGSLARTAKLDGQAQG